MQGHRYEDVSLRKLLRRNGHHWGNDDDFYNYNAEYVEAMREIIRELTK